MPTRSTGSTRSKEHIQYHKDGSIWATGQTIDGVATGYWEWFRKDGTKMRSGHFENGEQVGDWTTFDRSGEVYKVTTMNPMPNESIVVIATPAATGSRRPPRGAQAMLAKPKTIDEYLAALSDDKRAALEKLRKTIRAVAPEAEECISYQLPAFRLHGRMLVAFGAWASHCAFYPGSYPLETLKGELWDYDTGKGTIRFRADNPLPVALVRKLVKARIAENETLDKKVGS